MTLFDVYVTRVTQYQVDALDSDAAESAVIAHNFASSTIPELIDEQTTRVDVEEVDERMVVQVRFPIARGDGWSPSTYAYAVPDSLSPRIGDDVVVPGTHRVAPSVGRIVEVGRGGYEGPLTEIIGVVQKSFIVKPRRK